MQVRLESQDLKDLSKEDILERLVSQALQYSMTAGIYVLLQLGYLYTCNCSTLPFTIDSFNLLIVEQQDLVPEIF